MAEVIYESRSEAVMEKLKKTVIILFMVMLALISFAKVSEWAIDPDTHTHSIQVIEGNKNTVLKLAAASTAASAAITLLPGDSCTPIAEQISKLSSYFLGILSVLYLEKYMLTLMGFLSFKFLIPIGCIFLGIGFVSKKKWFRMAAYRLILVAVLFFSLIPLSVKVSDIINQTYESTYDKVVDESEDIKGKPVEYVTNLLNHFIDALAVIIVTSCLIPVIVFGVFVWFIKTILASSTKITTFV